MKTIIASLAAFVLATAALSAAEPPANPRPIAFAELSRLLAEPKNDVLLVDVRTAEEFKQGRIGGAVLFPYDEMERRKTEFAALAGKKDRPIVVYCRTGRRSSVAADTLVGLGYTNVADFGGIGRWKGALER